MEGVWRIAHSGNKQHMSEDAYERFGYKDAFESGDEYTLYAKALAWVTVVPEAILYFKNLRYTADGVTRLRLAQALGLPALTMNV